MRRLINTIFISIVILLTINNLSNVHCTSVSDMAEIFDVSREIVHDILKAWEVVGPNVMENKITPPILKSKHKKLLERLNQISETVTQVEALMSARTSSALNTLQHDLSKTIRLELRLDDLLTKTAFVESAHQKFKEYLVGFEQEETQNENSTDNTPSFEQYTLQNFAENIVSHSSSSILSSMEHIHYLLAPVGWNQKLIINDGGVLKQLRSAFQEAESNLCNVQQSLHQLIYNIYTALQMTQLKGYTMMQFSWMLLRLYGKGNFTMEAARGREKYISRMKTQIQKAKEALKNADQSYQRCDPERQIQDETYTSITKLLQGYLVNEVDLNSDGSCRGSCGDYSYTQQYGCFKNKFCSQQKKCNGRIVDCRFMDSDMSVCQADSDEVRYNWINYENGITLGHTDKSCSYRRQVDSWWRWVFWHCSYCMCICDDPFYSDRYINLRPAISNLSANKVVTALRFVKVDHIIHLQIQEGLLMPKAIINETSVEWRDVASYKAGSTGEKDKDYHMFSWEERAIDLDDVTVTKPNYVMTGVKFRKIGTHLNLEIQITPFNFTTGVLNDPHHKSEWISNDNTDKSYTPRTEVRLDRPDVPILFSGNKPNSKHDQFMMFTHTDVYKDVAQHTVPYIDTQIVGPSPPAPLVGAGIMHRGLSGSGGYIAPKVFTYSMVPHLQDDDFNEPPEKSKAKHEF